MEHCIFYRMIYRIFQFFCLAMLVAFTISSDLTWINNLQDAKTQAQKENKRILLVFSGSDWCRNCILLDQEVFSSQEFQKLAEQQLVLVKADFPRKKKNQLGPDQQTINGDLAKKFNAQGEFPKVVLMDSQERVLLASGYQQGQRNQFLKQLNLELAND